MICNYSRGLFILPKARSMVPNVGGFLRRRLMFTIGSPSSLATRMVP